MIKNNNDINLEGLPIGLQVALTHKNRKSKSNHTKKKKKQKKMKNNKREEARLTALGIPGK